MEKQSNLIHSQSQTGLTTLSNLATGVVIRNQPKEEVLKHISVLLLRLGKLYGIKDFDEMSAVMLAEWVYEQYKYEEIQIVTRVLHNPPSITDEGGGGKTNWRLTPDTIREWMRIELEKVAEKREQRHNERKIQTPSTPIAGIDYESYKKRLESGWLDRSDKTVDEDYEKFKTEYLIKKTKSNP